MRADLHVHSTASDGTCTPHALVELAIAKGVSVLAIADHDSVEGIAEALDAAADTSVKLVPAVELSAVAPDGADVHILGYFIDPADARLGARLADLRIARERRATAIVSALTQAGDAGGLAVLAHPGSSGVDDLIHALVAAGLRGIEAYHSDHSAEQRSRYAAMAADMGLLVTGGSDFHGPAAPNPELGSVEIPDDDIAAFMAAGAA